MLGGGCLLRVSALRKAYGPVQALTDVDFELRAGEVHALVGENGAGKSTLSRIIAGLTAPDRGQLEFKSQPYAPASRKDAERHGVHIVMQELNLIPTLSIAENLFLDCLPNRAGWIDRHRLRADAQAVLDRVGLAALDPDLPVSQLGVGHQQLVEIARSLWRRCEVLILDEPTAALTDPEVELLFAQVRRLRAAGTGILYISHRLEEIQRIADRISVLRDGRMAGTRDASEVSLDEIVRLMVGRDLDAETLHELRTAGPVALSVRGLSRAGTVRDVSFEARRGEILGFAGLMGSGLTETMRAVFGADRPDRGEIRLHGRAEPARIRSPRDAVRHGIALLTEDRKAQGLLLPLPVRANVTLATLRAVAEKWGLIRRAAEVGVARDWIQRLAIRCHSEEQPAAELSGGNQQKVVLARWLFRDCDILIFDEPTRGIDVGAKFEIYKLLNELAGRGKAVIVVSSDLKELMAICDRIAVMSAGCLAATFTRGEWTQDKIMAAALSEHLSARPPAGGGDAPAARN